MKMSKDYKLVLIFAADKRTFDWWIKKINLFPEAFGIDTEIYSRKNDEEYIYKYAFNANAIRGTSPSKILLLRDWDHRSRNDKIREITLFIWGGSKVVGDKKYVSDYDWKLFQDMSNEYLLRLYNNSHQDWRFDNIVNRFKGMEL